MSPLHNKHPFPPPLAPSSTNPSCPPTSRFQATITSPPMSPRGNPPPDPLIILGIFLIIATAAYGLHVFLWTYFPPDAIIPNDIDPDITGTDREPGVRRGRRLLWREGFSTSNSNNKTGEEKEEEEEEEEEEGESYELYELRKSPADEDEGAFRPRSYDAYAEDDGDEHAESARFIMLPKHPV